MTMPERDEGGRRVLKYEVGAPNDDSRAWVVLPGDAELLSVGVQEGQMFVWALSDPDYQPEHHMQATGPHRLIVVNTGQFVPSFPDGARFLGTVTSAGIVWHVWDGDAETTA